MDEDDAQGRVAQASRAALERLALDVWRVLDRQYWSPDTMEEVALVLEAADLEVSEPR